MFNSRARYLNVCFKLATKIIGIPFLIVMSILFMLNIFGIVVIIPDFLYGDKSNHWLNLLTNFLFFGIIGTSLGFVFLISRMIVRKKSINHYVKECYEIINSVVIPDKKPRVLYVYTTHNDFMGSRLLQNIDQSYDNFEVWVSDGSTSPEWREKIKKFCHNNNINLFQLDEKGSKNKGDNLNQFFKNYKGEFDYLLIGDADEVFHKNFVEYAIKMFCSNKIKNLAYVSPLNINYRSKGLYPNVSRIWETSWSYWASLTKSFSVGNMCNLAGQSCLISKESIISCNGSLRFDDGNLEDWYLESIMIEKLEYGMVIPCVAYYEPDVNINSHFKRLIRIGDWRIRWWKIRPKEIIHNYNEKYYEWYSTNFRIMVVPLIVFLSLSLFSVVVWLFANYWNFAFSNNILFWIFLGSNLFFGAVSLITNIAITLKLNFKLSDYILYPFVFIMWSFVANIYVSIHWFKSLFLGKYSSFGGSGANRFLTVKNSKTASWWISFVIFTTAIIVFNVCIFLLSRWTDIKWLIIIFNTFVGSVWFGTFSYLVLWYANYIPYNSKFNRDEWIQFKDVFKKII